MMEAELLTSTEDADVISFVDEAGDRGYLRTLTSDRDSMVSVICALPVPANMVSEARELLRPPYERFCNAAPEGAKLHITDAFKPGNEEWAKVANPARDEIFQILKQCEFRVVFAARRLKVAREMHELNETLKAGNSTASNGTPPRYAIKGANRPSSEQIDDQVMTDLTLVLEAFMECDDYKLTDLHFDEVDRAVAERYAARIEETRNISDSKHVVTARNLKTQMDEKRTVHFRASSEFDTRRVGKIIVAGKLDPLIFAVDVVANSLWRHVRVRPTDATLNDADAIKGWILEPIAFYDRSGNPSPMDRI